MNSNVCNYCSKSFSTNTTLLRHQTTTKSCLALQGKEVNIECANCKKVLKNIEYYKQHKIKCDQEFEEKNKLYNTLFEKYKSLEKHNEKLEIELNKTKEELSISKLSQLTIDKENEKLKMAVSLLERQNDKLHSTSTSVTMKLAEKVNTVNHNNNTVVINTNQLTNDVLRQCAATFSMDNARNIGGITRHLTTSLENHVTCTDPSRNIFKYTNENDEEITDQNLEILLPQYLSVVKERNNFFYNEVLDYFNKNNVSFDAQNNYQVFYTALNSIIERTGQQNKYTEKCKQQIVKECKRRFLEKNKNKDTTITKELSIDDVMTMVIETGGSVHDFVDRYFRVLDDEETDEQFIYRRQMEDLFREKKREWLRENR